MDIKDIKLILNTKDKNLLKYLLSLVILDKRERAIIKQRYFEGFTVNVICDNLNITVRNYYRIMSIIYKKLLSVWKNDTKAKNYIKNTK